MKNFKEVLTVVKSGFTKRNLLIAGGTLVGLAVAGWAMSANNGSEEVVTEATETQEVAVEETSTEE